MLRSTYTLAISGLIASVAVAAKPVEVRRDKAGSPAVTSGSIRYTPKQTPAAARTITTPAPRTTTSGSIHYASPRTTPTAAAQPNVAAGGSIHFSKPPVTTTARPPVTVGARGDIHAASPDRNRSMATIVRPGTTYRPTPRMTLARPPRYQSTDVSTKWHRPPVRPGYRPPIAPPIRGFDRSRWSTILRPWNVAPVGGGHGMIAGHGYPHGHHHYIYHPDGGRVCYYRPPAWGTLYLSLPSGAISFVYGRHRYYCWAGVYYLSGDSGYRVMPPPPGAVVSYLPPDYSYMDVDGIRYFYSNNVYYTYVPPEANEVSWGQVVGEDEGAEGYYTVVDPPIGADITELPSDYEMVLVEGRTWCRVGDAWYLPVYEEDTLRYIRAPRPE